MSVYQTALLGLTPGLTSHSPGFAGVTFVSPGKAEGGRADEAPALLPVICDPRLQGGKARGLSLGRRHLLTPLAGVGEPPSPPYLSPPQSGGPAGWALLSPPCPFPLAMLGVSTLSCSHLILLSVTEFFDKNLIKPGDRKSVV